MRRPLPPLRSAGSLIQSSPSMASDERGSYRIREKLILIYEKMVVVLLAPGEIILIGGASWVVDRVRSTLR
jgi:hypothetical protein